MLALGVALIAPMLLSGSAVPLQRTFDSPRALAGEVLRCLEARDAEGLRTLAISEAEFKGVVWPEMPAHGTVPADYAWRDQDGKSRRALIRSLQGQGGRRLDLLDVRFRKGVTAYGSFVVHRQAQLLVRDERGRRETLDVLGSVIQRDGRYKLLSYIVER